MHTFQIENSGDAVNFIPGRLGGGSLKVGMIFPGQGSQYLGMGKDFYDSERIVQEFFEDASACLNKNFVKLCFAS